MRAIPFDHIAIAARRLADAPPLLVGVLGGVPLAGRPAGGVFAWGVWRFANGGRLEVLEPLGDDGFLHRFLARHGPGVHHVTFTVPGLDEACRRAEEHGYAIVGRDESDPAWREAFLHPRQAQGIVVQLAQPGERAEDRPRWRPPGLPDPPPPVAVVGLRLRARSAARARRQWEGVLGGQPAVEADGALVFRWPGSPMRLAVEVGGGPEGPVAIELASDRPLALPAGPDPGLGARFVRLRPDLAGPPAGPGAPG